MWVVKIIGWTGLVALVTTAAGVSVILRRYKTNSEGIVIDLTNALAETY